MYFSPKLIGYNVFFQQNFLNDKVPRRLSLDSSCLQPAGGRTPLREITLEPQGEVLTYNPKVDSGLLVQNIR